LSSWLQKHLAQMWVPPSAAPFLCSADGPAHTEECGKRSYRMAMTRRCK
jgi:hypothetical protein